MPPSRDELKAVDETTASTDGHQLGRLLRSLLTMTPFPRAKLSSLLSQLMHDIYELEGLVIGEDRTRQKSDSSLIEASSKSRLSEMPPSLGEATPIQTIPEMSTDWGALACHHIRQAQIAIEDGDEVTFWRQFYAARRMELFGLEELGQEFLEMQAQSIKLEAAGLAARNGLLRLDTPRKEAIKNFLGDVDDAQGTPETPDAEQTEQLTANRVGAAMHVLHEFYVDQRLTGRILKIHLQSFIAIMTLSALTFITAFLSIPLQEGQGIVDRIALLQSPISGLVGLPTGAQLVILVLIVVLGIMGASVSGLLSLSRELQRSKIPEQAGTVWFAVARLATGGVAALMLFLFLTSGVVSLGDNSTTGFLTLNLGATLSVSLVFSLAFVAGFSERLLVRVVKSVAGEDDDTTESTGIGY